MNQTTKISILQYLILLTILSGGFYAILIFKNNSGLQTLSVLVMSFSYLIWGIIYHLIGKTFHIKIVVEYTLLAVMVATLLLIILSLT